jgi:hypothetical protein
MKISHSLLPITVAMASALTLSTKADAGDLTNFNALNQTEFLSLSKDLAAASSTKAIEPASTLGITGFDVNASTSVTVIHDGATWAKASGDSNSNLLQTKLSVTKGLSSRLDLGGFVSKLPSTNVSVAGLQVKYALLEGNAISPAIAVRGTHSRIGGVSEMELNNTGMDLLISKGFVGFTPYAGVGSVYSTAKATGKSNEHFTQSKSFVGVSWNVLVVNFSTEYDRTGQTSSMSLKAGVRF